METGKRSGARASVLWQLFASMLYISAFTFGGGFVIITFMKRKFVDEKHWIDEQEMLDLTALAQSCPGAIAVNAAILVGWRVGGWLGMAAAVLGTVGAIVFPMDNITDFLYLIGSVFAPMIAVQIADFYILHRDKAGCAVDVRGLVLWAVGFVAYRLLMQVDLPLGSTIPDIALTVVLCVVADKLFAKAKA